MLGIGLYFGGLGWCIFFGFCRILLLFGGLFLAYAALDCALFGPAVIERVLVPVVAVGCASGSREESVEVSAVDGLLGCAAFLAELEVAECRAHCALARTLAVAFTA